MLWFVFMVLFLVLFLLLINKLEKTNSYRWGEIFAILSIVCVIFAILSLILGLLTAMFGYTIYSDIVGMKSEADSLYSEMSTMRNTRYEDTRNGTLIGGSLDNANIASTYARYCENYALKKAAYNSLLSKCIISKTTPLYYFLGSGFYIPNKVLEMKPL